MFFQGGTNSEPLFVIAEFLVLLMSSQEGLLFSFVYLFSEYYNHLYKLI